jgi:hypothetical protein
LRFRRALRPVEVGAAKAQPHRAIFGQSPSPPSDCADHVGKALPRTAPPAIRKTPMQFLQPGPSSFVLSDHPGKRIQAKQAERLQLNEKDRGYSEKVKSKDF